VGLLLLDGVLETAALGGDLWKKRQKSRTNKKIKKNVEN
jgi:hypothetical protein